MTHTLTSQGLRFPMAMQAVVHLACVQREGEHGLTSYEPTINSERLFVFGCVLLASQSWPSITQKLLLFPSWKIYFVEQPRQHYILDP